MKEILKLLCAAYIGAGLFGGLIMQAAVPAMNWRGVVYYSATWPAFLHCARSDITSCSILTQPPVWMTQYFFTFEE